MDGVVYGTAVGLGFAALENVLYVASNTDWASVAIMRGVLSVPGHGAFGAIAGAYIARARFGGALGAHRTSRWRRPRLFLLAWLIPVILHTLFDGSLFSLGKLTPETANTAEGAAWFWLMLLMALAVGFGAIVFAVLLARRIARRQKVLLQTKRLPPVHWRAIWARSLLWSRHEPRRRSPYYRRQFDRQNLRLGIAGCCGRDFEALRQVPERCRQAHAWPGGCFVTLRSFAGPGALLAASVILSA